MKVSVIVIGDELLIGQVVDTNSGFLARTMAPHGWEINDVAVIADSPSEIRRAVKDAFDRSDVILTTGGLGPTRDDLTKQTLCEIFGGSLREDPSVTANIREVFRKRGLSLNALTAAQALVPTSCRVIQNPVGTAPVMWFETASSRKILVAMPGVPFETEHCFSNYVFPQLLEAFPRTDVLAHRTFVVAGTTESALAMRLSGFEQSLPDGFHLAYLPRPGIIRLRLDAHDSDPDRLSQEMDRQSARLVSECGNLLLCDDDLTPAQLLLQRMTLRNLTIATAESCTGGNIAHTLTSIPGASAVVQGGIVAYSNNVKIRLLGVDPDVIDANGAVSIPVVRQMARGAIAATGADIAVATSGIAGPGGGTAEKPVGTVCIAAASADGRCIAETHHFPGNRSRVIDRATTAALLAAISLIRKPENS